MFFHSNPLSITAQQQDLILRMQQVCCAFQFSVQIWPQVTAPTEADHQTAVITYFENLIRPQYDDLRQRIHTENLNKLQYIQAHSNPKSHQQDQQRLLKKIAHDDAYFTLRLIPERMSCIRLPPLSAQHAYDKMSLNHDGHMQNWSAQLCHQFIHPPYELQNIDELASLALWSDFCDLCGLNHPQADIYDWVRHQAYADGSQENLLFSNYFDEGLDWWGVWCLSVYQPDTRTLAVITASEDD
ncbi:hypothetical protein [Neisseria iguanae]|uniref:Uncharacterized protein n=1 Tax=Neisseria iguanae TaxID=90242 RepID=A0A2P7TXF1_9NEIS|nr:hypothetical protein [Neisseria iguanae]PSJ79391.1 hypothetical protein C7N83_12510 [Neisseria iguanae]